MDKEDGQAEMTEAETWYETARVPAREHARLTYDLDVDVCVIGGGLAGLTVAREVALRGWSVAVLEQHRIAGAASGRNTGIVMPGFSESIDRMVERIGLDHTKELWALSVRGLDYVRRAIAETGMSGVDPVDGWLDVSKSADERSIRSFVERLRWIGGEVEAWPAERVRAALPNPRYFGAVHYPTAFHINPLNYALGLAAAAETAGARLFEDTPAVSIDAAGVRKRIATPAGRVRAPHVVLAGNTGLGALMPKLSATILPLSTYVMVTQPLGAALDEVIRYRGAVSDGAHADNHYRVVVGDRLMWAGRLRAWTADPRRVARGLAGDIRRAFPALGPVEPAYAWAGTIGRTIHHMPQIGEAERGVWVAGGFGSHGLNATAMAGELIARGIVENDETWRLFAPYELVWAGGRFGKVAAQAFYWGTQPFDRLAGARARRRERARLRKARRAAARVSEAMTGSSS